MKIATVVGARPQFIKAAVVSRAITAYNARAGKESLTETIIHTGQHYDDNMSGIFFREMQIPQPAYHLGISESRHGRMTGQMLAAIEDVLLLERPDVTLVYGDTNSTLAGALAAVKLHVPVAHVEAGLRSFNLRMPEEINRVLVDCISTLLFCPTETAGANLRREGVAAAAIDLAGDVMYDAVLYYRDIARATRNADHIPDADGSGFCLATVHRAENTDEPERLRGIVQALEQIALDRPVIMPIHPRTRRRMTEDGLQLSNVQVIDPVGYFDMLKLLEGCSVVLTDSGGLQKEAFFLRRPCITLRDETEWVELVDGGYNVLAGADSGRILNAFHSMKDSGPDWSPRLYGDGRSGERIVRVLSESI
jgi:UDP-GlcNAc3NAcA epimerase